jgi:hypothetical protein
VPKNAGINNAQNVKLDQDDNAIAAHTKDDVFRTGTVQPPAISPAGDMWFGTGNTPDNYNITDNANLGLETGLKVHVRGGADYTPTGSGPNGEQDYSVAAGVQSPTRASWNFDYDVNTAAGVAPGDTVNLTAAPGLSAYDFKMEITQSGPQFLSPHTAIFDLNTATHLWVDENNSALAFGGDDFQPPKGASADVMAHVAENSVNLGFAPLQAEFGPLATSTAAGTTYDIKLAGFTGGSPNMVTFTHDVITLHA